MENNQVIESPAASVPQLTLNGVMRIPAVKQVLLLVGVAASVAAGFAIVLWSQEPSFARLYSDLDTAEAAQVAETLRSAGIEFELDTDNGVVRVAESRLHDARLELAAQGLPQGGSGGMDMLDQQSSFGVSQFMEGARYQRALEEELERTITHIGAVSDARVHVAMPRQSAFVRDQNSATAAVLLTLYRGRDLEADQAAAIVQLVAGSIENLAPSNVTVIDQNGRSLSTSGQTADAQASSQLRQTHRVEDAYRRKIEDLLTPLVGVGRVRAQVSVNMDFTVTEETRESFDPAGAVVRSEHINEQERRNPDASAEGVPGALSNQPPEAAGGVAAANASAATSSEPVSTARESTRNFELDRTISRVRPQSGTIARISVAVLVDDQPVTDDAGGTEAGFTPADIARFETLVRETVGFDDARGDTIVVMNAAFRESQEMPEAEEPAIWEQPFVQDTAKQLLGVALVLALAFGLVRPMLRSLVTASGPGAEFLGSGPSVILSPDGVPQLAGSGQLSIPPPSYDEKVAAAKNISGHDPARVAQVVRKWVTADE